METPWLESLGCTLVGRSDAPLGAPQCHMLPGGLGHPGTGGWQGSVGCHFPFMLGEDFATLLPPPGGIKRVVDGSGSERQQGSEGR